MRKTVLQDIPNLWRAESLTATAPRQVSSDFVELDQALGGGWPVPGLVELLHDQPGIGELQLLLPLIKTLAGCATQSDRKPVLWINPPYLPQAMALTQRGLQPAQHWLLTGLSLLDAQWAVEQAVRSGGCAMVLAWLVGLNITQLRRLKLATLTGAGMTVLFRPPREATQTSTANVRLQLHAHAQGLQVQLLKVQGRRTGAVLLPLMSRNRMP